MPDHNSMRRLYADISSFSTGVWPQTMLRPYQLATAQPIIEAVRQSGPGKPNQFAIVFSRQAGKDELVAQMIAYLLNLYQLRGGKIVLAAPTERQAAISKARLLERLDNRLNRGRVQSREGYIVGLGRANARFLSAAPTANVRGETASLLLIANEAQDIAPERWDAVFDPMAASTNATTLFLGTVWTAHTLLARQMRYLRELETLDGQPRVFRVDWQSVAQHIPSYGERVQARIDQFGEQHPFIQTEYFLRELDGSGGLFGPERRALMVGQHARRAGPEEGKTYCLLVDVAGEDETSDGQRLLNNRRDATAVTVVEVNLHDNGLPSGPVLPTYRVVQRYAWTGVRHTDLYGRLVGLARDTWAARYIVVDATGIGATLASFLDKALPRKVLPFVFSATSKSELGWNFVGIIDSGRYKDYAPDGQPDTAWFWRQLAAVEYEVRPGPGQLIRWSVPDPTLHDDLVISAALTAVLDGQDWKARRAVSVASRWGW